MPRRAELPAVATALPWAAGGHLAESLVKSEERLRRQVILLFALDRPDAGREVLGALEVTRAAKRKLMAEVNAELPHKQ